VGMGWVGLDGNLCVGLFYEHRFAMLISGLGWMGLGSLCGTIV
jgi:hypothetical protein